MYFLILYRYWLTIFYTIFGTPLYSNLYPENIKISSHRILCFVKKAFSFFTLCLRYDVNLKWKSQIIFGLLGFDLSYVVCPTVSNTRVCSSWPSKHSFSRLVPRLCKNFVEEIVQPNQRTFQYRNYGHPFLKIIQKIASKMGYSPSRIALPPEQIFVV